MRRRETAAVVLVLGLAAAGFVGTRAFSERDAHRDSERRAEVTAVQIRARLDQGAALIQAFRSFMAGAPAGRMTNDRFKNIVGRWFSPAGFAAAAWVQRIPHSGRASYERLNGAPIVTRDARGRAVHAAIRASYLPATLVSGIPPTAEPGVDLSGEANIASAIRRRRTLYDVTATPLSTLRDGRRGLFLVTSAQRVVSSGSIESGFLVLFVPEASLHGGATGTSPVQLSAGDGARRRSAGVPVVRHAFVDLGQRFEVAVPREPVHGAAALLPWIIVAGGLALAALTGMLGVSAARRERAQRELAASRERIVAASDDARRRIERDLHDGTQQRLVSAMLKLRGAHASVPPERDDLRAELSDIATDLTDALGELRELARGIHPAILNQGGLGPALSSIGRRCDVPVELDLGHQDRLPEPIEVAAYYVASEALANVSKHAHASHVDLSLRTSGSALRLSIRDDGVGGVDHAAGSGLVSLRDRVEALGGTLDVRSAPGRGTQVTAELPLKVDRVAKAV
jgi:signal transduction histidine kinase